MIVNFFAPWCHWCQVFFLSSQSLSKTLPPIRLTYIHIAYICPRRV
jgi:thiol-disulfide isomerase/thioredoxin